MLLLLKLLVWVVHALARSRKALVLDNLAYATNWPPWRTVAAVHDSSRWTCPSPKFHPHHSIALTSCESVR